MFGAKITWSWQVAPARRAPPHGFVPEPATDQSVLAVSPRVRVPAVVLVAVTVLGRLEETRAGLSKSRLVGLNVRGTVGPPVPAPLRLVIWGRNPEPLTMKDPL